MDRRRGTRFGRDAERYDRSRPRYPEALIDAVLGPRPAGVSVLDIATGTGIAARLLAARGARVLGVERSRAMAEIARRHGIPTEVAPFESWSARGRTFEVVTCAQAWHWLDPVAATTKVGEVLRPGGRLCLFWNVGHHPDELVEALRDAYRTALPGDSADVVLGYAANGTREPAADFQAVVEALGSCPQQEPAQIESFPWRRSYSRDEWLDQLPTHSDHAALPAPVRKRLLKAVGQVIDDFGGSFEMTYTTVLITAPKR